MHDGDDNGNVRALCTLVYVSYSEDIVLYFALSVIERRRSKCRGHTECVNKSGQIRKVADYV